jgi:hypothetical protein
MEELKMKKYTFDFSLDAWIQCLEIPAHNLDEAKEKLGKMSIEDLIEYGYVKDFNIINVDVEEEDDEDEE